MLALSSVYNHYRTTYAQGAITKYDAHKKSELRDIYNYQVKQGIPSVSAGHKQAFPGLCHRYQRKRKRTSQCDCFSRRPERKRTAQ